MEASINTIKSVQQSARYQVLIGEVNDDNRYIAINTEIENFRAVQTPVSLRETANQVVISQAVADALMVQEGDWVRLIAN